MSASRTIRHIASLLRPFRGILAVIVSLTTLLSVLAMLPPLLTRAVIDKVIGEGRQDLFFMLGLLLLLSAMLHAACGFFQVLGVAYVGQSFVMRARVALYRHLLNLGMAFYSKQKTGQIVNRLMGDSTVLQQILSVASVQVVSDLVTGLFAATATLFINWRLAIPLFLFVGLFATNYRLSINRIKRFTRDFRSAEDRVAAGVQNRLVASLTVKTFGTELVENETFFEQSSHSLELARESQAATGAFSLNTTLLQNMGRIVIFFLGCAMVLNQTASYGDVVAFTAYATQLLLPAVRVSQLAQQFQNVAISANRLFELLDEQPRITEAEKATRLGRARGEIVFERVHFAYEPNRPVLRDFSLHVNPGQTVALVGPTGCGKTTVLSLLMRLFDINRGSIRLDGHDLRTLTLASLRRQYGIVLQESLLFTVSIAENIRYGRHDATREEVEKAARVAEIYDDIMALPGGFDAIVGSREVQLSVGQKQRIAIARAVLSDPAVLIMDEATSALDSVSEKAIQTAMEKFLRNRTAFIVAHRLSTIRNADQIVLLGAGRIVEQGTHDQLMRIPDGKYRNLYLRHAGKGVIAEDD